MTPVAPDRLLRVCALLTSFNRRDTTLVCLQALRASSGLAGVQLDAVLVDDASRDGTADAVRAAHPWVQVVEGDGTLFWCRGMYLAFETALAMGCDYYLWLNDDTMLMPDAVARLLGTARRLGRERSVIVVGSTVDATDGRVTYGGEMLPSRWKPLQVERLQPADTPQRCDSMTGNIVLVSAAASRRVGNLDPRFEHSMGDTDYALRAVRLGVEIWLDSGFHGVCKDNSPRGTWCDRTQPLGRRWSDMMTRKGLPWRSWLLMTRRHAGVLWPFHFALPYVKVVLQSALGQMLPRQTRTPL